MKKLIALLAVCGFAFAFVACGGQKAEEAATEEAPATEEVAPATEEADSTEVAADSTAAE
ncbi:MAG TPA: hypothetical protein PLV21_09090 [Cyclobacteriaceae bacterium]|nr:hypothetical protein [Cyclobacteriaceae bacterium]HRJ82025.1 hypothetical protein [Cyclobacteriaceae bacterium]